VDRCVDDPLAYVAIAMCGNLGGILMPISVGTKLIVEELAAQA